MKIDKILINHTGLHTAPSCFNTDSLSNLYFCLEEKLQLLTYEQYSNHCQINFSKILSELLDIISTIIYNVHSPKDNYFKHRESYARIVHAINTLYNFGQVLYTHNEHHQIFIRKIQHLHFLLYTDWTHYFAFPEHILPLSSNFILSYLDYTLDRSSFTLSPDVDPEFEETEKFVDSIFIVLKDYPFKQDPITISSDERLSKTINILWSESVKLFNEINWHRTECIKMKSSIMEHTLLYIMKICIKIIYVSLIIARAIPTIDTLQQSNIKKLYAALDHHYLIRSHALDSVKAIYDIDTSQYKEKYIISLYTQINGRDAFIITIVYKALQSLNAFEDWEASTISKCLKRSLGIKTIYEQEISSVVKKIFHIDPEDPLAYEIIPTIIEILGLLGIKTLVRKIFKFMQKNHQYYLRYHPECELTSAIVANSQRLYQALLSTDTHKETILLPLSYFFKAAIITAPQLTGHPNLHLLLPNHKRPASEEVSLLFHHKKQRTTANNTQNTERVASRYNLLKNRK